MQDSWQRLKSDSISWEKDTEEFSQFTESVACREYTLPRDEKSSDLKGWIRGNTKNWICTQGQFSLLGQTFSWLEWDGHGLEQQHGRRHQRAGNLWKQFEDFAMKTNVLAFASRSKAKAKPRRRTLACSSTRTVPIRKRTWTDIEPEDYSPIAYPVSKQLSTLLRHGHLLREEDGAIEFWRVKEYLRNDLVRSQHWSDGKVKECNGKRRR